MSEAEILGKGGQPPGHTVPQTPQPTTGDPQREETPAPEHQRRVAPKTQATAPPAEAVRVYTDAENTRNAEVAQA